MMDEKMSTDPTADKQADLVLQQLLHLKSYERPDPSRMTRNKQNIMRSVRQVQSRKRKPLLDLLELNIPWFFAEPKYGIAALFVAFLGLQYVGMSTRQNAMETGIYTSSDLVATYHHPGESSAVVSNRYPSLPSNYQLFSNPQGDQTVVPAAFKLDE
ncbi:hypothetical protein [Pontiella agarivorans]|uniref:Uncharacterized protein n=1 Tax=Pontiella agarivorans TaxID=3038953 RepID=A0ABU5MWF6_9BACT|nr:hypothetical protein [Pontiella agarivorans]MDZ8118286.1 hypothetical protein [Pontiella agarivorans]